MAFLPDEPSPSRLFAKLAESLNQRLKGGRLASLGWFQYRDHDRLVTAVSTELAAHAFLYLGFDSAEAWRADPDLAIAIVMFLRYYHPRAGTPSQCAQLMSLCKASPVDRRAVEDWFVTVFPPDSLPEE